MKIALISDLHANFEAVQAIAPDLVAADRIVCLGDILGYYCQVNETAAWVREHATHCVLGNHDHFILTSCPAGAPEAVRFGVEFARRTLVPDHLRWLRQLPLRTEEMLGELSCLFVHGSPWDPLGDYLYADHPRLAELDRLPGDVIAFGQTHRFLERRHEGKLRLNPGAVGQSRDPATRACACAMMLDTRTRTVDRLIRPFDATRVAALARAQGAGDWIGKHLLT